jgi:hypothetical protein
MQHWSGAAKIKFYSITSVASRCKPINRVPVKALIIKRAGHRRDFFAKSAGVRHCGVGIQRFPVRPDQCPLCAKSGLMHCNASCLFDHLVGATEQRQWYVEAKRFSGFEIDH